ncbi:hypothetical protein ACQ3I4_05820 [Zafaria sp. Z1313]|uniref:hypothetical protein n=1 Tax=unclassified Zafaria TaxID=2828765 RepID=UPI002E7858FF|nr:hypothetical protein [Zafaria sp. J156]MEE1622501.1 hypothetical protein [Zafaria sp. J156]
MPGKTFESTETGQRSERVWCLKLVQKEHNRLNGHPEALYGVFSTREKAVEARDILIRKKGRRPGKFRIVMEDVDSEYDEGGFFEYVMTPPPGRRGRKLFAEIKWD